MSSVLDTGTSLDNGHRLLGDSYGSIPDLRDGVAHPQPQRDPAFDDGYQLLSALFDRRARGPDALEPRDLSEDGFLVVYQLVLRLVQGCLDVFSEHNGILLVNDGFSFIRINAAFS